MNGRGEPQAGKRPGPRTGSNAAEARAVTDEPLEDGHRVGRYLVIRDVNGGRHAIGAGAVAAISELDDDSLLMLPGGRLLQVPWPMERILAWLDGRS